MTFANITSETLDEKQLIKGDFPQVNKKVTIASGQNLTAGAVLGKVTATGKHILSLSGASDGSEVASVILAHDVDATAADKEAMVYLSGEFFADELTFGTGHTAASLRDSLRALNIYI